MSSRRRVVLVVALAAAAAALVAIVAVVASGGSSNGPPAMVAKPRPGRPPLTFALGFRADRETAELLRAEALYNSGKERAAGAVFDRYGSLEAQVGAAFATWPKGTLDRMEQLGHLYPDNALVEVHLGLVRLWTGLGDPVEAWQAAQDGQPDSPYAVLAGNLLHPNLPRGLPTFVPSFSAPPALTRLSPQRQLAALRERAASGGVRDLILYGVGLQRVGRPVSAQDVFEKAARRAPGNVEAQVAAAVGSFEKDDPSIAFGRLGPLVRTFPDEPTVRFHLGLLLLWTGRVDAAERQFRLASKIRPASPLAREAARYLATIRAAKS